MIQFQNTRTDDRMEGWTDPIFSTLPATAGIQKYSADTALFF